MKGLAGPRQFPNFFGNPVHINGKADAAIANERQSEFFFPHTPMIGICWLLSRKWLALRVIDRMTSASYVLLSFVSKGS